MLVKSLGMLSVTQFCNFFTGQQRTAEDPSLVCLPRQDSMYPPVGQASIHRVCGLDLVNTRPFFQVTEDALVYSTFLLHDPRPVDGLSILRTNRVEVPIECRYPRSVWDALLGSWVWIWPPSSRMFALTRTMRFFCSCDDYCPICERLGSPAWGKVSGQVCIRD